MKKVLVFLPLLCLISCSVKNDSGKLFTPGILANQLYSVESSKDTALVTLHGTVIRIVSGTFNVAGNVQVEIKEAFTPAEMLAAGITTESNGRLLLSGGMIYINATANGEVVGLIKPIKISIPNSYYDSAMQVFRGVETDSGTINWVDPVPVDSTPQASSWIAGKSLFESKCASCHSVFRNLTGPAMANVEYRGPWSDRNNIYDYVRDPIKFMAGNNYSQKLNAEYGSVMTAFPALSDMSIDAILDYIKNQTKRPGALDEEKRSMDSIDRPVKTIGGNAGALPGSGKSIEEPCADDTVYLALPKNNLTILDSTTYNPPMNIDTIAVSNKPAKPEDMEGLRSGFTDPNPTSGMYDFEIKTFGWFNIDAYVEGYAGTKNVKLWVQLQVQSEIDMKVYLFCPEKKMLSIANNKTGDKYYFDKIDYSIPLFINERAVLFAFGSKGNKMYYGISEFKIQEEQTIQVIIKETTDQEIRSALKTKQLEGIDLGIEKKEKVIIKNPCDEAPDRADSSKNI